MKLLYLTLLAVCLTAPLIAHAEDQAAPPPPAAEKKGGPMKMRLDTDGDGAVSKAEFMKAQEERFADMDTDGNGSVSDTEMKASWDRWKAKRNEMRDKMKEKSGDKEPPPPAQAPSE